VQLGSGAGSLMQRPAAARPGGPALADRGALAPGFMLRCMDLWPAVLVQASFRCGSARVLGVEDGAARGSGPGARGPGPRAPAVCCAVWTVWPAVLVEVSFRCRARLACGLTDAGGRPARGRGVPALAGRRALAPRLYAALYGPMASSPRAGLVWCGSAWVLVVGTARPGWAGPALAGRRALAPRLYAALYGPMASSPRAGLVWVWTRLGCGLADAAAGSGQGRGPARLGRRRPLAPRLHPLYGPMASSPRAGLIWVQLGLGAGWLMQRPALARSGAPALAGRRALAPRLYAALCGTYGRQSSVQASFGVRLGIVHVVLLHHAAAGSAGHAGARRSAGCWPPRTCLSGCAGVCPDQQSYVQASFGCWT